MSFKFLSFARGLKQNLPRLGATRKVDLSELAASGNPTISPLSGSFPPRDCLGSESCPASEQKTEKAIVQGVLKMSYILLFPFALASLPAIPAFSHYALYPHCVDHPPGQPTNCSPTEWIDPPNRPKPSELTFKIESDFPRIIHLKFYSKDRNVVWPGSNRVYVIDDYDLHSYRLSCNGLEKICYGAWEKGNTSTYWGVGRSGTEGCRSCCYICGTGDAGPINLTD